MVDSETGAALDLVKTPSSSIASGMGEDQAEWEKIMTNVLDYNLDEANHPYSPAIPGGKKQFTGGFDLALNMGALGRSMIGALTIINSWTNSLIDEKFGESLALQALEDDKILAVSNKIFEAHILPNISFELYTEDEAQAASAQSDALELFRKLFNQLFLKNTELISLIRSGASEANRVASRIISTTIADFSIKYESIEVSDDIEPEFNNAEGLTAKILGDRSLENEQNRYSSESLADQITLLEPNVTQSEEGLGKLTLVAYARFLALAIYKMQSLFFAKSSMLYVGFNPMPRVFDSPDDVLTISMSEINKIETRWSIPEIIDSDNTVFNDKEHIELTGARYLAFINKAYEYLNTHVNNARNLIITPRALAGAKKYVVERLGDSYLAKYLEENPDINIDEARKSLESQRSRIDSVFPIHNAGFNEIVASSEGNKKYSPFNIIPNISEGAGARTKANFNHAFYDGLVVEEDPDTGRKVLTDPERNFNSGKMQVGTFTRPTLREWPLPKHGYHDNTAKSRNHVGVPIPLYDSGGYKGPYSELKDLGLVNLNIVANVPYSGGEDSPVNLKLNIGFLLERGYSTEHYTMIHGLKAELEEIKKSKKAEMKRLNTIKSSSPKLIAELTAELENLNGRIQRNKRLDNQKSRNQVIIYEREAKSKQKILESLKYELENLDALREKLNNWYQENVMRIQAEYNSLPYSVNTQKSTLHMNDIALSSLSTEAGFANQKKDMLTGNKTKISGALHVGLTDPIMAYNLIKNNELHGQPYVDIGNNSVPEELIQDALIGFIVGVYGLDEIAKAYVKKYSSNLRKLGMEPATFSGRDLLEFTIDGTLSDIGQLKYKPSIMPGSFYDVSLEDSSMSLYAQSIAGVDENQKMPTLNKLKKMYSGLPKSSKSYGITSPYAKSEAKNAVTVSHRAAKAMKGYIRKVTVGQDLDPSGSEARDQTVKSSNNFYSKILKRADILSRIMIMQATTMIHPSTILEDEV